MTKLLLPLISLHLINGVYHITYKSPAGRTEKVEIREQYTNIRFDTEYDSEDYDPLSTTLHLSPGRLL